ncbi:MAG: hypothetical protein ACYDC1_25620 [Limisphaerales bacterium]
MRGEEGFLGKILGIVAAPGGLEQEVEQARMIAAHQFGERLGGTVLPTVG